MANNSNENNNNNNNNNNNAPHEPRCSAIRDTRIEGGKVRINHAIRCKCMVESKSRSGATCTDSRRRCDGGGREERCTKGERYADAFPRYAYRSFLEVSSLLCDAGLRNWPALVHTSGITEKRDRYACTHVRTYVHVTHRWKIYRYARRTFDKTRESSREIEPRSSG